MDSPLAYIGGKSKLSKTIIDMIPEHKMYCEVFAGGAWVFFRRSRPDLRPSMISIAIWSVFTGCYRTI